MTTLTAPAAKSKASRTTCTLCLTIGDVGYSVEPVKPGECGTRAFRLSKLSGDGAVYDLLQRHDGGHECDCPDFTVRHADQGTPCKHLRAAIRLGLLDPPAIVEAKAAPLVNRNNVTVDNSAPAKAQPRSDDGSFIGRNRNNVTDSAEPAPARAPGTPAAAPSRPAKALPTGKAADAAFARPVAVGVPADAPSARDKAAAQAFGLRLPARAATPTPSPREIGDRIVAMLACPDCQGEGCAACTDDAPAAETPAPSACCPAGESRPCRPCQDAPGFADDLTAAAGPLPTDEPIALDVWLQAQADVYDLIGTAAGRFLADHIRRLADDISACMSPGVPLITVAEAEGRLAALSGVA